MRTARGTAADHSGSATGTACRQPGPSQSSFALGSDWALTGQLTSGLQRKCTMHTC